MLQALEGAYFMGSFFRNTRPERGIAGLTGACITALMFLGFGEPNQQYFGND